MISAAIAQLKAALSEFLAHVKAGEELIVTERGRPIAKIVPIAHDRSVAPPHLLELERAGLARIGAGRLPPGLWDMPRPRDAGGAGRQALSEERASGR